MEHNLKIYFYDLLDAGTLHLDRYGFTVSQSGPVHLADGCGSKRVLIKIFKKLFQGDTKLSFDDPADFAETKRWNIILKFGKLLDELSRNQVRTR